MPDFVKLSHNGASDAQAQTEKISMCPSTFLWSTVPSRWEGTTKNSVGTAQF